MHFNFKKTMGIVLFSVFFSMPNLSTMGSLRNCVPVVAHGLSKAALARFSTMRPPSTSTSNSKPSTPPLALRLLDSIEKTLKIATGVCGAFTVAIIAHEFWDLIPEVADLAPEIFLMERLDKDNVISDELSPAIVRFNNQSERENNRCSCCIVASVKNPDMRFVLTAAHCISEKRESESDILIRSPQDPCKMIPITGLTPVLIDRAGDIAVLRIPVETIKNFESTIGNKFPAISATQLASIEPRIGEIFSLQGYPNGDYYREKLIFNVNKFEEHLGESQKFSSTQQHSLKRLGGASGGPLIVIRDGRPEVQGLIHAQGLSFSSLYDLFAGNGKRNGFIYGVGCGKLPRYLEEAEKIAGDLQAAEKNKP